MAFSPAILVWIVIFAIRAFSNQRDPSPGSAGAVRRPGMTLDGWAGLLLFGQVSAFAMLIVGLGAGLWRLIAYALVIFAAPGFLAWRVCQPLGLRRTGQVLLDLVLCGPVGRHGRSRLFAASLPPPRSSADDSPELPLTLGRRPKDSHLEEASPWACCAMALEAEVAGRIEEAARLARGVLDLPGDMKLPGPVARLGVELLAVAALRRRDWPEVLLRASAGRGRAGRFLRLLARARLVGDVPTWWLWLSWALAPRRRLTFGDVRAVTREAPRSGVGGQSDGVRIAGPWSPHLRLLQRVAQGERPDRRLVLHLARGWDHALGAEARARLKARALELGVLDAEAASQTILEAVVADLEMLATVARGPWPPTLAGGLGNLVVQRAEDRLYRDLEPYLAPYRPGGSPTIGYPLEEWGRWIRFRDTLERLVDAHGKEAILTAWYQGVRSAAWNWPCKLLDVHQGRAAWACVAMFHWAVELGAAAGDDEAVRVNRENVAAAARLVQT